MLISTIRNPDHLDDYKNAQAIIAGYAPFDARSILTLSLPELQMLKSQLQGSGQKLYINLLAPLHQEDIAKAKEVMEELKDIADGIYVSDEGFLQIAFELDMMDKMIFSSETLITNAPDVRFYLKQEVQAVSLAHDLSLEEIAAIAKALSPEEREKVELLIHGHFTWMESKRPFLQNYMNRIEKDWNPDHSYSIRELNRPAKMPIFQDEKGSTVFSDQKKSSYEQIHQLRDLGIGRFRMDGLFTSDENQVRQLDLYSDLLSGKAMNESLKEGSDQLYKRKVGVLK